MKGWQFYLVAVVGILVSIMIILTKPEYVTVGWVLLIGQTLNALCYYFLNKLRNKL